MSSDALSPETSSFWPEDIPEDADGDYWPEPEPMEDFTQEDEEFERAEERREAERLEIERQEAIAFDSLDDGMDIDIPRQIPGITLNGGPVFEEDFE
jgi:hypothetical protein